MMKRLVFVFLALVIFTNVWAVESGIGLSPMYVVLKQCSDIGTFTVFNGSDDLQHLSAQALKWDQTGGKDIFASADNLLITPPLFTMQPHEKQIVRVGLRGCNASSDVEQAFRVIFHQNQATVENKHTKSKHGLGIKFLYGFNVSLYVEPKTIIHTYTWQAKKSGDALKLLLVNSGNVRVAVYDLKVSGSDGKVIKFVHDGLPAALAGKTIVYNAKGMAYFPTKLKISGRTNWGNFSETIPVN